MAFSSINYEEPDVNKYQSISLKFNLNGEKKEKVFDTGDVVVDFYNYCKFISQQEENFYSENPYISGSSSWDHFFMDDSENKYKEENFNPETGEFLDWRKGTKPDATEEERQLYYDCCHNKYPRVICLPEHKSFNDVKEYVKSKSA